MSRFAFPLQRGIVAVALLLSAQGAVAGDLAAVRSRGKLIMLAHPTQDSPFVAANLDVMREKGLKLAELRLPGQFKGAEVDLMKGFARRLGVGLEIHAIVEGYDALFPALVRGEGDVVASEITITPKRQEIADFSAPYLADWLAVVVRRDRPREGKLASVADLAGKKGAVIGGSSHLEVLHAMAPEVKLQLTGFDLESLEAVEHGDADFTLIETSVPVGAVVDAMHPDLQVAFRLKEMGNGIAVRKGSDLRAPLDAYLARLKKSGELKRILDRNGVQTGKKSPPPKTPKKT